MNLSRRERTIGTLAVAVIAVFAADRFAVTPYLDLRDRLEKEKRAAATELQKGRELLRREPEMAPLWKEELAAGLKTGAGAAESMTLNALRDWAAESGLTLSSVKPEGTSVLGQMEEISFQAIGEGTMRNVIRFLYLLENTSLPVKPTDLQLTTRKEGADELTLQVRVAALCVTDTGVAPEKPSNGRRARREES